MSNEEKILELLQGMNARLDRLEGKVDNLEGKVNKLEAKVDQQKTELQAEMSTMKTELQAKMSTMKAELQAEMSTMKAELQAEIKTSGSHTRALQEAYFEKKFGALTAGHDLILEKMVEHEELEEMREDVEGRLDILEAVVKLHSHEIEELKKAQ